jgi:hypothetical protein
MFTYPIFAKKRSSPFANSAAKYATTNCILPVSPRDGQTKFFITAIHLATSHPELIPQDVDHKM